ncbi:MAG: 50S ribosomal protein L24 [bacterium]
MMSAVSKVKANIRKGDFVIVLSGDDKGKKGKVLKVFPRESRLIVEGINIVKKHTRPTQKMPQGGTVTIEQPLHISKVRLICPACKQPTRVIRQEVSGGKRARVCKNCGEVIDK